MKPTVDVAALVERIEALGSVGAIDGGGVCRVALTDADADGRAVVIDWMRAAGLTVTVDTIGNVFGTRAGTRDLPPVMIGSHIDTVATGGKYDGNLGVLAGLAVVDALDAAQVETAAPITVAFFTNEEGVRFAPDMMGSLVFAGGMTIEAALDVRAADGTRLGDELQRIGAQGSTPCGFPVGAYIELHIEQGPVLEAEGIEIGVVTGVQGISWTEFTFRGTANHAGTTPMALRKDAAYVAAAVTVCARELTDSIPGQLATVGVTDLEPNLTNVVARTARITVDLRNDDATRLAQAIERLDAEVARITSTQGVSVDATRLVHFDPVVFDSEIVNQVERIAHDHGRSTKRMVSGAGHDAQMMARVCPAGMIFIPSRDGLSHNPREYSSPEQVAQGAAVLLDVVLELASAD